MIKTHQFLKMTSNIIENAINELKKAKNGDSKEIESMKNNFSKQMLDGMGERMMKELQMIRESNIRESNEFKKPKKESKIRKIISILLR